MFKFISTSLLLLAFAMSGHGHEAKKNNDATASPKKVPKDTKGTALFGETYHVSEAESTTVIYGGLVDTARGKRVKFTLNGQAHFVIELIVKYPSCYLTTMIRDDRISQTITPR